MREMQEMEIAKEALGNYKDKVDPLLREYFQEKLEEAGEVGVFARKAMEGFEKVAEGGKRLRGFLLSLGYRVGGGELEREVLRASMYPEILQDGLLVHDDVMDRADLRRGKPTVQTYFESEHLGESMAVCIGDLCYAWAVEVLIESGFEKEKLLKVLGLYSKYFEKVVLGQMLDLEFAGREGFASEEEIKKMMKLKTASYTCVLPFLSGYLLAGGKGKEKELKGYAENLGMAFQIRDDFLGIFGKPNLGKPVGVDLEEKKQTLLSLYLRKEGSLKGREVLESVWGKKKIGLVEIEKVREVMKSSGSLEKTEKLAEDYVEKAKEKIGELTEEEELREILAGLAEYTLVRVV